MIKIKNNQDYVYKFSNNIDKDSSMVIIGDAKTEHLKKQLLHFDNEKEVELAFGDSSLTLAYKDAKHFGCEHVFLINSPMKYDYIDISNMLMQYDFTYIVPISISLTDYFINPINNNKMYYAEYMLKQLSEDNHSTIITTNKHASLFSDIDHYISHMKTDSDSFANRFVEQEQKLNDILHVANNLHRYQFSNVVLAASLCSSKLDEYPNDDFGKAVFDLDELDTNNMDFVFFQNNLDDTSVEHLLNLNRKDFRRKDVMTDRLVKHIKRNLVFDEYIGIAYNGQQEITVKNKTTNFMDKMVGTAIENYYIKRVSFAKERVFVGNIVIELEITPIGRAESITVLARK